MRAYLYQAIALCRQLSPIAPTFGAHIALTGGTLDKDGPRKDIDIIVYLPDLQTSMYVPGLLEAFAQRADLHMTADYGRVKKAKWRGLDVDLIFPHLDHYANAPEYGGKLPAIDLDDEIPFT